MKRTRIAPGVYVDDQGRYWARPRLNRRSTWRLLKDAQEKPLTNARDAVKTALTTDWQPAADNFRVLAQRYLDAGCRVKWNTVRTAHFIEKETVRLGWLLRFYGHWNANQIDLNSLEDYSKWRLRQVRRGPGLRTIELEAVTLSNVLSYGMRIRAVTMNWVGRYRGRLRKPDDIRQARKLMPASADVIHRLADHLFDNCRSQVCGWLLLFSLFTGCRTSELRRLRLDAGPEQAGHQTRTQLHLGRRSKSGINPFVEITPSFGVLLDCFHLWHAERYPESPWYFPGRTGAQLASTSFGHSLARACRELDVPHTTPHAIRAYFVTLHRRAGVSDARIAAMIGDKTVALISQTYGDTPDGDALTFLPATGLPAYLRWQDQTRKVVSL